MKPIQAFIIATLTLFALATQAQDVTALLKATDKFRMSADNLQVETQINVLNADGSPDKERRYTVFAQAGRQSLVLMQSPAEKGQKVLMLGDDFWLLMPNSQRPLRITPMQKLLGDASTGDVASLTWAEDYDGRIEGETVIAGIPCIKLDITGQRKGVSYPRIVLYLARNGHYPVQAELYVASDKLAKLAEFKLGDVNGRKQVTAMVLTDKLQRDRQTELHYLSVTAKTLPDEYYNPAFLVRAEIDN
jgi:hypothetical protein